MDAVLARLVEELSRTGVQRLIEKGNVSVNGETITLKKYKLRCGDEVVVLMEEPTVLEVAAQDIPIEIVYEDDDVLIVNKAKGMVVHPGCRQSGRNTRQCDTLALRRKTFSDQWRSAPGHCA